MPYVPRFIFNLICSRPQRYKVPANRETAEKMARQAFKYAIKAENHCYNAEKHLRENNLIAADTYFSVQISRAELRKNSCLSILKLVDAFFAAKEKIKSGKSAFLIDILGKIKEEMKKLEIRINELKQNK